MLNYYKNVCLFEENIDLKELFLNKSILNTKLDKNYKLIILKFSLNLTKIMKNKIILLMNLFLNK